MFACVYLRQRPLWYSPLRSIPQTGVLLVGCNVYPCSLSSPPRAAKLGPGARSLSSGLGRLPPGFFGRIRNEGVWPPARPSRIQQKMGIFARGRLQKSEMKLPDPRAKPPGTGADFATDAQGSRTRREASKPGSLRSGVAIVSMGSLNVLTGGGLPSCPWGRLACLAEAPCHRAFDWALLPRVSTGNSLC